MQIRIVGNHRDKHGLMNSPPLMKGFEPLPETVEYATR